MARAALVLFDDDDPAVLVAGVNWPEFRLRSAIRAGATHIVVVAGRITPDIVAAIDHARDAGVSATLARTAGEAADLFHPAEIILVLSGLAIVDDALIERLMASERATLACVEPQSDPAWELIDARARWTGLARIDGAQVRDTAAIVGEWDLASTLLRQAVAARAKRVMLDERDALYRADHAGETRLAAQRAVKAAARTGGGWATRLILKPVVLAAGTLSTSRLAAIARFSPWLAAVPLAAGVALAWLGWPVAGAAMLLLGFLLEGFGALAERATGQALKIPRWRGVVLNAAAALALAGLVLPPGADRGPLVLAAMLVAITALAGRLRGMEADPPWLADVPGHVILVGLGAVFGPAGMSVGLLAALLHALASLAWLQNRLSRPLT